MSLFGKKPATLGEVVRRVKAGEQTFDPSLREFLDSFYANPDQRPRAIEDRPASIDAVHDAYVAAVAEHLAGSTVCRYRNGARTTATDFMSRSLLAVCSRSRGCCLPRARRPFADACCSSARMRCRGRECSFMPGIQFNPPSPAPA